MKTLHLCLGMLLLYSSIACKKDKKVEPATLETTVYGRVVLRGTEQKATNQSCIIKAYWNTPTEILGGSITRLIAETTTDSNGYYNLKFTAADLDRDGYYIKLETDIENHFSPKASQHKIKPGQKQELKLFYAPFAWIRLHTKNIDPQFNDKLTISLGGGERHYIWGPVERQNVFLRAGNINSEISCWLTRLDTTYNLTFKIFLPAFDTTYYYLEY